MNKLRCPECGHGTFEDITHGKDGLSTIVFKMRCAACHNGIRATFKATVFFGSAEQGDLQVQSRRKV